MTTAAANKTTIQTTWNVTRIQEEAVNAMTRQQGVTMHMLQELGTEWQTKFRTAMVKAQVEHLRKLGVKTPFDLVKAMAEFEVNVLGSKITVWGDDKQASMEYEYCACYNAMQKNGLCSGDAKQQESMMNCFNEKLNAIAKEFGMSKAEIKFATSPSERTVITFVK
jgi:hypothetical protein